LVRADQDETNWTQIHARQALVLGLFWTVGYIVLLAIPLVVVIAIPGISGAATIAIYGVAIVVDLLVALLIVVIGVRYASKAARGQLFSIPLVTPIVDRWLRLKRR